MNSIEQSNKFYILIWICSFYLTLSYSCALLVFRQVNVFGYIMSGSAFIYGPMYVLIDMLTRTTGRAMTIRLVILLKFFGFVFVYIMYLINLLPAPQTFIKVQAFNVVIAPLPTLFWSSFLGGIISGIVDVILYAFLQNKIKSFFIASTIATTTILCAHNIPTYYFTIRPLYPNDYREMALINTSIEACIAAVFSLAATWYFSKSKLFNQAYE